MLKEGRQLYSQGLRSSNPVPVVEGMDDDAVRCLVTLEERLRLKRIQEVAVTCHPKP